jgi:hypothetical protein
MNQTDNITLLTILNLNSKITYYKINMINSASKAIPFIIKNSLSEGNFLLNFLAYELSSEAEQFLNSISNNLSVVAVAGLYRTGKSYLLNRVILNRNEGFTVGPTINPCTKGLWLWN